jgi:hypothetical protein
LIVREDVEIEEFSVNLSLHFHVAVNLHHLALGERVQEERVVQHCEVHVHVALVRVFLLQLLLPPFLVFLLDVDVLVDLGIIELFVTDLLLVFPLQIGLVHAAHDLNRLVN